MFEYLFQVFDSRNQFFVQLLVFRKFFGFLLHELSRRFCQKTFIVKHSFAARDFFSDVVELLVKSCNLFIGIDEFAERNKDFGISRNERGQTFFVGFFVDKGNPPSSRYMSKVFR